MSNKPCPECGTIISYGAKSCSCGWGGNGKALPAPPKDYTCQAHGCPMAGSISNSIGPNGTYYCRFHFNKPIEEWQEITRKLRTGETLANEAKGKEDYFKYVTEKFKKEGMKEFPGNVRP